MNKENYVLGLDLGVGSVGWSCVALDQEGNPCRIIDLGSVIFDAEPGSVEDRRVFRGTRRLNRRRVGRLHRTEQLFLKYNYLTKETMDNMFDQENVILPDVYETRIKGKREKLTYEELFIILKNYVKHRGFKSNRKTEAEDAKDTKEATEEQKLLFAMQETTSALNKLKEIDKNNTITDLLIKDSVVTGKFRNTTNKFNHGIKREMIDEEVQLVLAKQEELGLIDSEFVRVYLEDILLQQRSFSAGPDSGPYANPLQKMIGLCQFTHKPRAAKATYAYQMFVLVSKLNDIRFYEQGVKGKQKLSVDLVNELIEQAKKSGKVTYANIIKLLKKDVNFVGLRLSKKEYAKVADEVSKKPDKNLNEEINKAKYKQVIYELKDYKMIKNVIKKNLNEEILLTPKQYDLIGECFSRCKSDVEIMKFIENSENREVLKDIVLPDIIQDNIINFNLDFKAFGNVSLEFIDHVLPFMIQGNSYYDAAKLAGYDTQNKNIPDFKGDYIPSINLVLDKLEKAITNKVVSKTIIESRNLVNEVIRQYGKPQAIHIEMARDLTKNDQEKKELMNTTLTNKIINDSLREDIYRKFNHRFASINAITKDDLIQYKLYLEQDRLCPYTLASTNDESKARISTAELFTSALEVDHIIPFSITHDDRIINKVLVKQKENQEKKNQIPGKFYLDTVGYNKYVNNIKTNKKISVKKKNRFLCKEIDQEMINDYRARTLNDTRYAIKAFKEILSFSLKDVKIKTITGSMTAKLRGAWGLNNLCNSYRYANYKMPRMDTKELDNEYKILSEMYENGISKRSSEFKKQVAEINKFVNENNLKSREDHFHHAMDATIIACSNEKLRRAVEMHEIFLNERYNNSKDVLFRIPTFDDETGELIEYEEILKTKEEYLQMRDDDLALAKKRYPQPYKGFRNEVILRTYEMDQNKLHRNLEYLEFVAYDDVDDIEPIGVYHSYNKRIQGRLHKDTIYGVKETENSKQLTSRVAINTQSFNDKTLEKVYDKDSSQKYIYQAVKDWLEGSKNGEEAYKKQKGFPLNKNGNVINKVKIIKGEGKEAIEIRKDSNQYVMKENVVKIYVYQRENDEKLYFVGMDRYRILAKDKNRFDIVLWHGRDKNKISLKHSELKKNGFNNPKIITKGQICKIELKNGNTGYCRVTGFTSGSLEIKSITGDNYDLLHSGLSLKVDKAQQKLTVSTIKSIEKIHYNYLGKPTL